MPGYVELNHLADRLGLTADKLYLTVDPLDLHTVDGVTYVLPQAAARLVDASPWRPEWERRLDAADAGRDVPHGVLGTWDFWQVERGV